MSAGDRLSQYFAGQRARASVLRDMGPPRIFARGAGARDFRPGKARSQMLGWAKSTQRAIRHSYAEARDQRIAVNPALNRELVEFLRIAAPPLLTAIERHFIPLAQHAVDNAPVQTGRLRAGLALRVRVRGDELRVTFLSAAPYTFMVRYSSTFGHDKRVSSFEKAIEGRIRQIGELTRTTAIRVGAEFNVPPYRVESAVRRVRNLNSYVLPDGSPVKPRDPYWQRQARAPLRAASEAMIDTAEAELARLTAGVG